MQRYWIMLAAAVLLGAATTTVIADDFSPATFRGQPLTVAAEWEFINQNLTDLPPSYLNWVGDDSHDYNADCYVHTHPHFVYWQPDPDEEGDGRAYTQDIPGQLDFFLCNFIDNYPYKYIWVQITYGETVPGMGGVPFVYEVTAPNQATNTWPDPVFGTQLEWADMPPMYRTEMWYIPYNPDREYVYLEIPPYTYVDQIWIETISTLIIGNEDVTWGQLKSLYR